MTRAMTTTKNGSFLRACLGPLVRPMSRDPTEMTIDQGPRLGPARIVAALRVRRRVEGDTDARTSTGDPGVSVEGYVITPDGEYFDPDSQETFQTLEAWKAQRRSSRHRVVRASATESTDPVHGGLEEPEERNPNYYGDDTEPKRGSIPLDEAFTRLDKFVLHHIAAREKNFEPIVASYANKARNSDQVTKEQGDQSRTLNAAIASDRHGQREMAKRATG